MGKNHRPWTRDELFPASALPIEICIECGALVIHPVRHTAWHNKVADL